MKSFLLLKQVKKMVSSANSSDDNKHVYLFSKWLSKLYLVKSFKIMLTHIITTVVAQTYNLRILATE